MLPMNRSLRTSLECGTDYVSRDGQDVFRLEIFVRMYKLGIPSVCWLMHNGEKEVYWNQWQIFDLIRQNNIHPEWMRKEDHDELYNNIIPAHMALRSEECTGYPRGSEYGKHRRRYRSRS